MLTENELFQALIEKPVKPWLFQTRTSEALRTGEHVLLSAPTGTGKTWAALLGFIYGYVLNEPHADKIIYALPLRSLATSLYYSTVEALEKTVLSPLLTTDQKTRLKHLQINIRIQTGEQREDPFFQGDICFTTIDQLLTGYLNIPASLSPRLANINAGALVGALVVVDEIHLLEPDHSLATLLEVGRQLKGLTQFLLMSATLSTSSLEWLQKYFKSTLIEVDEKQLLEMPGQANKERHYYWVDEPISAEQILKHHTNRTIAICNTVDRAQKLYMEVKRQKPPECKIIILHSRYLKLDRKEKEDLLLPWFGPKPEHSNVILISTQVIEAGIDISADVLHTELCPANALLQRAGRSARYPDRNKGKVYVYALQETSSGKPQWGPYRGERLQEIMTSTEEKMRLISGKLLYYQGEKEIINFVHAKDELVFYKEIRDHQKQTRDIVLETIAYGDRSKSSILVRDIDSVSIYIHDCPETLRIFEGMEWLSVPRTSLYRLKERFMGSPEGWIAKKPIAQSEEEKGNPIIWQAFTSFNDTKSAWMLVIHPNYATYDSELGFRWNEIGQPMTPIYHKRQQIERFSYSMETFSEHTQRTLSALKARENSVKIGKKRLVKSVKESVVFISELEKILCIIHDAGKLREQYQMASLNWQKDHYPEEMIAVNEPLAHTSFDPDKDWIFQKKEIYNRGRHASEGAYAGAEGLISWLASQMKDEQQIDYLARIMISAIARHHAPFAKSVSLGKMMEGGETVLNRLFNENGISLSIQKLTNVVSQIEQNGFSFDILFDPTEPGAVQWLPLYFYLIRRLRLADQESFQFA